MGGDTALRPRALRSQDFPGRRDEAGRCRCRFCDAVCPGRRTSFCSDACVAEYLIRTDPGYARGKVFGRDRGVCAACGLDTEKLRTWLKHLRVMAERSAVHQRRHLLTRAVMVVREQLGALGFAARGRPCYPWGGHLWEADHIVPVVEGGGGCGLDNYRTLCLPCHKAETAALSRRRIG